MNKNLYLILALFVGGIGIHKMAAGKWLMGFLYLAFSWTYIPVVLSLFDFLIGIFKPADTQGNIYF